MAPFKSFSELELFKTEAREIIKFMAISSKIMAYKRKQLVTKHFKAGWRRIEKRRMRERDLDEEEEQEEEDEEGKEGKNEIIDKRIR